MSGSSAGFAAATDPVVLAAAIAAKLAITTLQADISGIIQADIQNTLEQAQQINTLGIPAVRQMTNLGTFPNDGAAHPLADLTAYTALVVTNNVGTSQHWAGSWAYQDIFSAPFTTIHTGILVGYGAISITGDYVIFTPPTIAGTTFTVYGINSLPPAPQLTYQVLDFTAHGLYTQNQIVSLDTIAQPFTLYPHGACLMTGQIGTNGTAYYTRASSPGTYIQLGITGALTTIDTILPNDIDGYFVRSSTQSSLNGQLNIITK